MVFRDLFDEEQLRLRVLLVAMIAAFGLLLAWLWHMQVSHGKSYQQDLTRQSVRRVRVPGMRGMIFDRNGLCMADNRASYCIALYLEELRQPGKWSKTIARVDDLISRMSQVLGLPRQVSLEDIKTHIRKRLPLPLIAWRDLDQATIAKFAERIEPLPGVDVYTEAVREYPQGRSAAHVVGYVGRADPPTDEEESYHYYLAEMAGKSGIEKTFDDELRGEAGGRLVRVDVSGFRHADMGTREPHNGKDILLTLDMRIQKLAEEALGQDNGAVVIVNPNNGDVLAMASAPSFDPNKFIPSISTEDLQALLEDERKPLVNRAIAGAYAPGSTFKPIVATAALESHKATPNTSFTCPGYFMLGKGRFACWYEPGHGLLDMQQALEHSCNVYFYHLGLQTGPEAILHMAAALGLGQKTEVALDYETPGLLADDAWKRRIYHEGWRDGDTCNLSIGQGALAATPIQMAMVTAALANGGRLLKPRLVMGIREHGEEGFRPIPSQVVNDLNWSQVTLQTVRGGMRDVVMSPQGTGKLAAIPNVVMAGKTGTAEIGRKGEGHKITWMICFAPFDAPQYAVAVMVEEGVTGGTTVAPRVKQIMTGIFSGESQKGEG